MRKRGLRKRLLAVSLALCMVLTAMPMDAVSAKTDTSNEEEQLKQELAKGAKKSPNGIFGFYKTQLKGTEGDKLEIQVVRQGGTKGEASVQFKAVDIMASYGQDYLLTVKESDSTERVLEANPDAKPLIEEVGDSLTTSDNQAAEEEATAETQDADKAAATAKPAAKKQDAAKTAKVKSDKNQAKLNRGEVSDNQVSWRELNKDDSSYNNVKNLMNTNDEKAKDAINKMEGVTCTLDFADGEYEKVIEVDLIDDQIAESDEQVLFALSDAKGAKLGDSYNGYLNIKDNEKSEKATFEMAKSKVSVKNGKKQAEITVKRTSGINQMSIVSVGTKEKTAKAGTDYTSVKQDLVFAPGMKEKTVTVDVASASREETTSFYVGLDDSSASVNSSKNATLVTLKASKDEDGEDSSASKAAEGKSWTDTRTPNKSITANSTNWSSGVVLSNVDIRLASEVKITFESTQGSTDYEDDCDDKTSYERNVTFGLGHDGTTSWSGTISGDKLNSQTVSIKVSNSDDKNASLTGYVSGKGRNNHATLKVTKVEIVYPGYTFVVENSFKANFPNNGYKARNYTAKNTYTEDKKYTQFGEAKVSKTGSAAATQQTIYRASENLGFSWSYANDQTDSGVKADDSNVCFEGYQLKKSNTTNTWSDTIAADKMDIMSLSKKTDYIQDNNTITVRPVFYMKTSIVIFRNINTGKGYYKGYDNGSNMTVSKLDTVQVTGVPYEGNAVRDITVATALTFATRNKERKSLTKIDTSRNDIAKFVPVRNCDVNMVYTSTSLIVKPYKNSSTSKNGDVIYYDKDKPSNSMSTANSTDRSFTIQNITMDTYYRLLAVGNSDKNYHGQWIDGTRDADESYTTTEKEKAAMPEYTEFSPVSGDILEVLTKQPITRVYYDFYVPTKRDSSATIMGRVYVKQKELFTGATKQIGVNGATVSTGGLDPVVTTTCEETEDTMPGKGYFTMENDTLDSHDYYLLNVSYPGSHGSSLSRSVVVNPDSFKSIVMTPEDDISVDNASIYKVTGSGTDEKETVVKPSELSTGTKTNQVKYRIRVHAVGKSTATQPRKAVLRFYRKDGTEITGKEVTTSITGGANGWFNMDFTPFTLGLTKGTTMTLQFYNQNGVPYYEYQTGLVLKESLGILDFTNSFKFGGVNTAIKLFGSIDSAFNLGWNGDFDEVAGDHVASGEEVDPDTGKTISTKTILVGFSKTILDDKKFDLKSVGKSATKKAETMRDYRELQAKSKKKDEDVSQEDLDKAKKKADEAAKKYDEQAEKAADPSKVSTSVTASVSLDLAFSFSMRFIEDPDTNSYYFDNMILNAKIGGGVGINVAFATPIGVTINIGFGVKGDPEDGLGSACYVIEQRTDSDSPKKYYLSDLKSSNDKIDVFDNDLTSASRKFDGYGVFGVNPCVYLYARGGVAGNFIQVGVKGSAQFNMTFYTAATKNTGTVNLNAGIDISILGVEKYWPFVSKDYSLFGGNASSLEDENYLYESSNLLTADTRDNLANRGKWNAAAMSAKSVSENPNGVSEAALLSGFDENAKTQIKKINTAGDYLAVYLDDDGSRGSSLNGRALYYTVYAAATKSWSVPQMIENDNKIDEDAKLVDLGDHGIAVVWSTASKVFDDNTSKVDMMNSMDLHTVIFDKTTKTLGDIMAVTKETAEENSAVGCDNVADVEPNIAYDESTDKMIVYYTKNEYKVSSSAEGEVIGDVVHPALTYMAYRTYSFADNKWKDDYTAAEKADIEGTLTENLGHAPSADEYNQYVKAWYGQTFFSTAPAVYVDEELDENGFWKDGNEPTVYPYYSVSTSGNQTEAGGAGVESTSTEVSGSDTGTVQEPKIIESDAVSYNGYGLFAYTVDYDRDLKTVDDRDVYLQYYDFDKDIFTHPIMITSDNVCDSAPQLSAFTKAFEGVDYTHAYLTWLSDGNIVTLNVSNVIKNCLDKKTAANGQQYYLIKKTAEAKYKPVQTMVVGERDEEKEGAKSAITDYQMENTNSQAYLMWTQTNFGKAAETEGETTDDTDALIETQSLETQIYAANYNVDAGEMGYPVQITSEEEANYSDLAFGVNEDGTMTALATKAGVRTVTADEFNAEVDSHNAQVDDNKKVDKVDADAFVPYQVADTANQKFVSLNINPTSVLKMTQADCGNLTAGNDNLFDLTFKNDGLDTYEKLNVSVTDSDGKSLLYETTTKDNGTVETANVEKIKVDKMLSGKEIHMQAMQNLDVTSKGTSIHVQVTDAAGKTLLDTTKEFTIESDLYLDNFAVEETEVRNEFKVTGTIVNGSNRISDADSFKITSGDTELATVDVPEIEQGGTYSIEKTITIDSAKLFTETTSDKGFVTATADFTGTIDGSTDTKTITREATGSQMNAINAIQDMMIEDGKGVSIAKEATRMVNMNIKSSLADSAKETTGLENLRTFYTVEDESVATVDEFGYVSGVKEGKTKMTAYVIPKNSESVASVQTNEERDANDINLGDDTDNYTTLPDSAIKLCTTTVSVTAKAEATAAPTATPTAAPSQTPALTAPSTAAPTATSSQTVKVGSKVTVGKSVYKVVSVKNKTVSYEKFNSSKKTVCTVPSTVKINGVKYKVTSIDKKAFKGNKKLKKITIGANVKVIRSKAFYGCSSLKKIIFKGKKAPYIGKKAFAKIAKKAVFLVPKKKYKSYRKKLNKKAGITKKMKIKKK